MTSQIKDTQEFDSEPMKIIGNDGQVKTVIIGREVTEYKHKHVIDETQTRCVICSKILNPEEILDAQTRI